MIRSCTLILTCLSVLLSACGDSTSPGDRETKPSPPKPAHITRTSGDQQSGTVGTVLIKPLVVTATDENGSAVSGASVSWAVATGDGSLSNASSTTDAQGRAQVTWTLGTTAGADTAIATAAGLSAFFTATAAPGAVATVGVTPGTATVHVGDSVQLAATAKDGYGNAVMGATFTWWSSEAAIARVSGSGLVTGLAAGGPVAIIAEASGKSGTASLTIAPVPVASVSLSNSSISLSMGGSAQLIANVLPANATNKAVTWTSSDPSVATVSSDGEINALDSGAAVITVHTNDGSFTATCIVHVGYAMSVTLRDTAETPIRAAQVIAFDLNAKTYRTADIVLNSVYWFHYPVKKNVIIIVADSAFAGVVTEEQPNTDSVTVVLQNFTLGSIIALDQTCYIPGFSGRLNPIRDSHDRNYLYADNISINGGMQQPVTFNRSDPLELIDANDKYVKLWIPFIEGHTSLINYTVPEFRSE